MNEKIITFADLLPALGTGGTAGSRASIKYYCRHQETGGEYMKIRNYGDMPFRTAISTSGYLGSLIDEINEMWLSDKSNFTFPMKTFFIANKSVYDNLLGLYLLPKIGDTAVFVVDLDDRADLITSTLRESLISQRAAYVWSEKCFRRLEQMLSWLYADGAERAKLISLMEGNLSNLLNKVETINRRRDNNTPQNATDPDADSHLSYYSKNVNESDLMTLMARIKEIKDNIFDEYEEWARAFEEKFAIMSL